MKDDFFCDLYGHECNQLKTASELSEPARTVGYGPKDFHEALKVCLPYFEREDKDTWLYVANHDDLWHSACLMAKRFNGSGS